MRQIVSRDHQIVASRRRLLFGALWATLPRPSRSSEPGWSSSGSIIVNASTGTSPDLFARGLSKVLAQRLHRPYTVENLQGAAGLIAARQFLRRPLAMRSMLLANSGLVCNLPLLSAEKLEFDPLKDFRALSILASVPFFLVASPESGIRTIGDIKRSDHLQYATSTIGSAGHIAGEMLCAALGIRGQVIPYSRNSAATLDIAANRVPLGIFSWQSIASMTAASQLVPVSVFSKTRTAFADRIATATEQGYPALVIDGWQGLFCRPELEAEHRWPYESALAAWVQTAEYETLLMSAGYGTLIRGPAEAGAFLLAEVRRYAKLIQAYRIS